MLELYGRGVSNGIAIGKLSFFSNQNSTIPKYEIDDIENELDRYHKSMELAKQKMEKLYESACERVSEKESIIFQIHIMILEDSKFVGMIENDIKNKKRNAEYAVQSTAANLANMFKELDDDYLQERYYDILDAANTLIDILMEKDSFSENSDEPVIIAADHLLPSETISFNKDNLLGFITNRGSQNSHSSILARTMGVPSVVQIQEPLSRYQGMLSIIDGTLGKIIINPDKGTIALYKAKKERYNKQQAMLKRQIGLKSITKNGQKIELSANIGLLDDIDAVKENDAESIGLFRSEFLFLHRNSCPTEDEQFEAYKTIIKASNGNKTIIRTVDLGADKGVKYLDLPDEKNPAMGFRGIRICISNKEFFKVQLKALYRASVFGKLCILLPMINDLETIDYIQRIINEVKAELKALGRSYSKDIEIGIMIETPASAIISDEISKVVDFISIGTNDLTQYTLAIDRENQMLEYFYQPYHLSILRLIKFVADNAHKNGKWVSICGELASDTKLTELFLALGIDELSMVPSKILKVRAKVRETDTTNRKAILEKYNLKSN